MASSSSVHFTRIIEIELPNQERFPIEAETSESVFDIKLRVMNSIGIHTLQQQLKIDDIVLVDTLRIDDLPENIPLKLLVQDSLQQPQQQLALELEGPPPRQEPPQQEPPQQEKKEIMIRIPPLICTHKLNMEVPANCSIRVLRKKIVDSMEGLPESIRLVARGGRHMQDNKSLDQYNLTDNSIRLEIPGLEPKKKRKVGDEEEDDSTNKAKATSAVRNAIGGPLTLGASSPAILVNDRLIVSAIMGISASGDLVSDNTRDQTHQMLHNLQSLLLAGGSNLQSVFKIVIRVTNEGDIPNVTQLFDQYFQQTFPSPTRSIYGVPFLPLRAKIDMDCEATLLP